jgi:hypothetical protein
MVAPQNIVRIAAAAGLMHGAALSLVAQVATAYRFAPGDTIRYHERTDGRTEYRTPRGPVELRSEHDAVIALAGGVGDTTRAWYEQLRLRQIGGGEDKSPETGSLLGQPFSLRVSPRGEVTMLAAPPMPASLRGVTDLSHQFDDFLIVLAGEPLRIGVAWADTVTLARPGSATENERSVHARSYRVVRDTLVDGVAAVVIDVRQRIRIEATAPGPQPGLVAHTVLEGVDTGIAVVAPSVGRLLGRTRTGSLSGRLTYTGSPSAMSIPQTFVYTSAIRLVR